MAVQVSSPEANAVLEFAAARRVGGLGSPMTQLREISFTRATLEE